MLAEINLLMSSLNANLPGGLLELGQWQIITSLYSRCDAYWQLDLIQRLSTITNMNSEILRGLLESTKGALPRDYTCPSLAALNQVLFKEQELFQSRAIKLVPGLQQFSMGKQDWCLLMNLVKGERYRRLTAFFILESLAKIKGVSYADLLVSFSKKTSFRSARPEFNSEVFLPIPCAKRRRLDSVAQEPSIVSHSLTTASLQSDLIAMGSRIVSSPEPVSPQKGFSDVHKTPGGTKIRRVFENNVGRVFLPLSPEQLSPSRSRGMVSTGGASGARIRRLLPQLELERPVSIDFTATLPKILERKKVRRRISQNVLMKASCRDVFMAHGIDTVITSHGSKYHWSHLIAHFLGGAQQRENLIPGTAASNYNTLELVEQFIAEKLIQEKTLLIDIHVTPLFTSASLIPDELKFSLSWDEAGEHFTETIMINPRSYRRESPATLAAVGFFREAARSLALAENVNPTTDLIP